MKTCSWCAQDFSPAVSYQIYCSKGCRELATKEKIAERSHINKRKKRNNKPRRCAGECGALLSIYNDKSFCDQCMINQKRVEKMLKELKGLFDYEKK
jgi:uncharacterized protein YmfQ (DUF2313 family)